MGLFPLPITVQSFVMGTGHGLNVGEVVNEKQEVQPEEQPKIDREWEVLTISVPSLILEASTLISKVVPGPFAAEYYAAWAIELQFSIAVDIIQSGLVVGNLIQNFALKPFQIEQIGAAIKANYKNPDSSLSSSLQNPITIRGPEQLTGLVRVSYIVPNVPAFMFEHEEGSGESKHIVKQEVFAESIFSSAEVKFSEGIQSREGVILYINESDKEPHETTGPFRPSTIPM